MKKKILYSVYIIAFVLICFIPGVLTPILKTDNTAENRALSQFPSVRADNGKINTDWTKEFDAYFSDHFAFRDKLVNLNSRIMAGIFNTSSEDDVIIGKDGWLYYGYTIKDFCGTDRMEQWEIDDIAHILEMAEDYAESCGTKLIFAAVPNKNTIYPEYMPYNYIQSNESSDLERIESALLQKGVDYCSLKEVLIREKEISQTLLYHKTDTHWNNYGALTAYNALLNQLGVDDTLGEDIFTSERSWDGDLQKMLFPDSDEKDEQIKYYFNYTYSYTGRFRGLDDLTINTVCPEKDGGLLMFRDSFGEAILPFMAESFGNAQFSRTIPYSLDQLETGQYTAAILEIVERNLKNLRKTAPLMPAPECDIPEYRQSEKELASCYSVINGNYIKLYGEVDPKLLGEKSRKIYAVADGIAYEAFPVYEEELLGIDADNRRGYSVLIPADKISTAEIIAETDSGLVSAGKFDVIIRS